MKYLSINIGENGAISISNGIKINNILTHLYIGKNKFNPIKSNVNELADFFGVSPFEIIQKTENKK